MHQQQNKKNMLYNNIGCHCSHSTWIIAIEMRRWPSIAQYASKGGLLSIRFLFLPRHTSKTKNCLWTETTLVLLLTFENRFHLSATLWLKWFAFISIVLAYKFINSKGYSSDFTRGKCKHIGHHIYFVVLCTRFWHMFSGFLDGWSTQGIERPIEL